MNGIPMRFDFSKTLNEQLDTFNYYKDRYTTALLKISVLANENKELKERIENAREYIFFLSIHKNAFNEQDDTLGFVKLSQTIWGEELLELLEGDE